MTHQTWTVFPPHILYSPRIDEALIQANILKVVSVKETGIELHMLKCNERNRLTAMHVEKFSEYSNESQTLLSVQQR